MSNLAQLTLLKDKQVESWKEYEEWKAYQERIEADAANQSLWGSIAGIVAGAVGFVASGGNPAAAKMAYTAGRRVGSEITEYTGYEPGYGSPDFKAGKFNVEEGIKRREDEEDRLSDERTANIIGITTDLVSLAFDYGDAKEFSEATALAETEQIATMGPSYNELTKGWEASPIVSYDKIVGYEIKDATGEILTSEELTELGITWDFKPMDEVWGKVTLDTGKIYDPITGMKHMPSFAKGVFPGGEPWEAEQMYKYLYPYINRSE